jgi:DNA-binding XRE family transcriptional regulator
MPAKDEGNTLKRFGMNVRARRAALELSQEGLAEKADLDRTYIGGIERGERDKKWLLCLFLCGVECQQSCVFTVQEMRRSLCA